MADQFQRWTAAMRTGEIEAAWTISSDILAARDPATRDDPALPPHQRWVWNGKSIDGQDVLVRCYHGLGDTIQFARYLPRLADRANSVTLEVQPSLVRLMAGLDRRLRILPCDPERPRSPTVCDIEITELPFALRAAPSDGSMPYLSTTSAVLPPGIIGLCHVAGDWDRDRAIEPDLAGSLLVGRPAITLVTGPTTMPVLNPGGCPFDMDATAALVAGVALVITVDTMIAHLAGALGMPTWLLLKHEPDWRWPLTGRTTPWYPSMRLYHQTRSGDWTGVIDEVAADLACRDTEAPMQGAAG